MTSMPLSLMLAARITDRTVTYVSVLALAGCASMAGVGGSAEFGCKAPVGVKCDSVSGTYYNALQQNLPSQQKSGAAAPDASAVPTVMDKFTGKRVAPAKDAAFVNTSVTAFGAAREAGAPLRSAARVLRLWIKPWEDSDGDLHSQSYVYVPIDAGRWLIDHYRLPSREVYAPIKPPVSATPAADLPVTAGASRTGENAPVLSGSQAAALVRPSSSSDGNDDGR